MPLFRHPEHVEAFDLALLVALLALEIALVIVVILERRDALRALSPPSHEE